MNSSTDRFPRSRSHQTHFNRRLLALLATGTALLAGLPATGQGAANAPGGDSTSDIRTPAAPATPRINGARVYGERPGHPFFYHLPVTGNRPVTISAKGLPDGFEAGCGDGEHHGHGGGERGV